MESIILFKTAFLLLVIFASVTHSKRVSSNSQKEKSGISSLEERFQALNAISELHHPILPLTLRQFRQLVLPAPRNFSVLALFTNGDNNYGDNDDEDHCASCGEALAWWHHVAGLHAVQEWRRRLQNSSVQGEERLYFASINIFPGSIPKVGQLLDISKPNFVYFANTTTIRGSRNKQDRIWKLNVSQFTNDEFPRKMHILDLISWIEECSGVFIDLRTEPPTLTKRGATAIWVVGALVFYLIVRFCDVGWLMEVAWSGVQGLNYKYLAVFTTIWCVSGQMFNHIRETGWAYYDNDRNMVFIARGHGYQMLSESLMVMILYGVNTFAMVQMIQKGTKAKKEKIPLHYSGVMFYFTAWMTSFVGVLFIAKIKG